MDYTKLFNKIDSLSTNKLDILSDYNINKQLLTYDLRYGEPVEKISNIEVLCNYITELLTKYQGIVGGYYIDDPKWIKCDETTQCRFKIKKNQIILYNSVFNKYNLGETLEFMELIRKKVEKSNVTNGNIKLRIKQMNTIYWILFIIDFK